MDVVQIEVGLFQEQYSHYNDHEHAKSLVFRELIQKHTCFQERPENHRKGHHYHSNFKRNLIPSRKQERTKIGSCDLSREGVLRKDLITMLNKLTHSNLDVLIRQTRTIFQKEYSNLFVDILMDYCKKQVEFQALYLRILESIYSLLSEEDQALLHQRWFYYWDQYMTEEQWKFDRELVEQSHNYDDFCEYIKEKKKKVAFAQVWARLISNQSIRTPTPLLWVQQVFDHCETLQMEDKVDKTVIDSYVEQLKDFYRLLPQSLQSDFRTTYRTRLEALKKIPTGKACYFKVVDFLELLEKNER